MYRQSLRLGPVDFAEASKKRVVCWFLYLSGSLLGVVNSGLYRGDRLFIIYFLNNSAL